MLTGERPFQAESVAQIAYAVRETEPQRPRKLHKGIPKDLETICLKCLQKEPAKRYASCRELAEDLGRWLRDVPVAARPIGRAERAWRWCRRNPVVACLSATAAILLASVALVASLGYVATSRALGVAMAEKERAETNEQTATEEKSKAQAERRRAEEEKQKAEAAEEGAEGARRSLAVALRNAEDQKNNAEKERDAAKQAQASEAIARKTAEEAKRAVQEQYAALLIAQQKERVATRLFRMRLADDFFDRGAKLCDEGNLDEGILRLAYALANYPDDAKDKQRVCRDRLGKWTPKHHPPEYEIEQPGVLTVIAVSPNRRCVASGCEDGKVYLWDSQNRQLVGKLLAHRDKITAVAFSPDGERILTASADGTVCLWKTENQEPAGPPIRQKLPVDAAAFSPDGKTFATSSGKIVSRWETRTLKTTGKHFEHDDRVKLITFSRDGKMLLTATGGAVASLTLWDALKAIRISGPVECMEGVNGLAIDLEGRFAVTANSDNAAKIWTLPQLSKTGSFLAHQGEVRAVTFSKDGKYVATGSADQTAKIWNWKTRQLSGQPLRHRSGVMAVDFAADTGVVTGAFKTLYGWNLAAGVANQPPENRTVEFSGARMLQQEGMVTAGALAAKGLHCVVATQVGPTSIARVWNCSTGDACGARIEQIDAIAAVAISPDENIVAATSGELVALTRVSSGRRLGLRLRHALRVRTVSFSNDGKLVLTGGEDGVARFWEATTGNPIGPALQHDRDDTVLAIALAPDRKIVATGTRSGVIRRWDFETGKPVGDHLQHQGPITAIDFCPGGAKFASASEDRSVQLWNAVTGEMAGSRLEHPDAVRAIAFTPDGSSIVTGCDDGIVRLWDLATGRTILVLSKHEAPVVAVGYCVEKNAITAIYRDQVVRVQPLSSSLTANANTVVLWAEVQTGMEVDENGQVRKLSKQDWERRDAALRDALRGDANGVQKQGNPK